MRAIASALALSDKTSEELSVIWPINSDLKASFHDLFNTDGLKFDVNSISQLPYSLTYELPRKRNLYVSYLYQRFWFDFRRFIHNYELSADKLQQIIHASKKAYITSGLEFYPFDTDEYRKIFVPSQQVKQRMDEICGDIDKTYIGVHIRRTDNAKAMQFSPIEAFKAELHNILQSKPEAKFYLATDDEVVKREFITEFGTDRIYSNPNGAKRASLDGMIDGLAEMFILSKTSNIIGSYYSSYNEAAAMLGNVPLHQIKVY
jgi:hypothetical protein